MSNDNSEPPKVPVFRLVSLDKTGVSKDDAVSMKAVQANAYEPEDEYQQLYIGATRDQGILEPPYNLRTLDRLAQENNALNPCIEAMVTNIDGTGYDFENADSEEAEDTEDDEKIEQLNDFFNQPWPGVSFVTMRKDLRRDLERTGNAYIEVLRNPQDEIVFLRRVDAKMMRLLMLDAAVPVDKMLRRKGTEQKITVMQRERRFCQLVNGVSLVYFREFGASRDLNKNTAKWAEKGQRLPATERATEIIHLTALPDAHTPYGVPRWINQIPSILGSRKAEEFNLEFFDNGGIPPALIILQGGTLQPQTKDALELKMGRGTASSKNRIQVLEVMPTGGTFEKEAQARVVVERFGAERQDDSMFENYDAKCEERVRRAFRLPPIFVGAAEDYSFASAVASYAVAEAQVFKPERDEFDEVMSVALITAMGYPEYKMISKPLVIEDATLKLTGIEAAVSTKSVEMKDVIYEINEAVGTNIKFKEAPEPKPTVVDEFGNPVQPAFGGDAAGAGAENDNEQDETKSTTKTKVKTKGPNGAGYTGTKPAAQQTAALKAMTSLRKRDIEGIEAYVAFMKDLETSDTEVFGQALATARFVDTSLDPEGLAELSLGTLAAMSSTAALGCGHSHG